MAFAGHRHFIWKWVPVLDAICSYTLSSVTGSGHIKYKKRRLPYKMKDKTSCQSHLIRYITRPVLILATWRHTTESVMDHAPSKNRPHFSMILTSSMSTHFHMKWLGRELLETPKRPLLPKSDNITGLPFAFSHDGVDMANSLKYRKYVFILYQSLYQAGQ